MARNELETRGVLAGVYRAAQLERSMLTHVVELDAEGRAFRVLCNRVRLEHLADGGLNPNARASCATCARRDSRTSFSENL